MPKLVTVEQYDLIGRANLAQQFLRDNDIQAFLADDQILAMDWMLSPAIGGVKVQVAEEDAEKARLLLQQLRDKRKHVDGPPIEFKCDECSGLLSFPANRQGGVENCKHCGCYVDVPSEDEDVF